MEIPENSEKTWRGKNANLSDRADWTAVIFSTYNLCLDWQRLSSEEISQTLSDDDNIFPHTFYLLEHVFSVNWLTTLFKRWLDEAAMVSVTCSTSLLYIYAAWSCINFYLFFKCFWNFLNTIARSALGNLLLFSSKPCWSLQNHYSTLLFIQPTWHRVCDIWISIVVPLCVCVRVCVFVAGAHYWS